MRRWMGRTLLFVVCGTLTGVGGGWPAFANDEEDELLQLLKETAAARQQVEQTAAEEPAPAEKYRLAYKFQPNQFAHFDTWQTTTIRTQYGEADETTVNEVRTRQHYRVVAVESDGNAILEVVINRIHMTVQFGDNPPTVFDSTQPASECPPQFRHILKSVGKPRARMKFAPNGQILSVTKMIRELTTEGGQAADAAERSGSEGRYNFLAVFPTEPIPVGAAWKDTYEVDVPVDKSLRRPVKLQRQFTLASVENGRATIHMKTAILTPVHEPEQLAKLIQLTPSATIVFDIGRGAIVSRTTKIDEQVIGIAGAKSSLHATGQGREKLLTDEALADERSFFRLGADQTAQGGKRDALPRE
jgi:hypothetical protein